MSNSKKINNIKCQYIKQIKPMLKDVSGPVFSFGLPAWIRKVSPGAKKLKYLADVPDGSTILLFDWLDHVHNYSLLGELRDRNLRIFVTHCYRHMHWAWGDQHFHEMDTVRARKLFKYYGFEVVKESKVFIWRRWYEYLRLRTFMRLLIAWQHHYLYELRYARQ